VQDFLLSFWCHDCSSHLSISRYSKPYLLIWLPRLDSTSHVQHDWLGRHRTWETQALEGGTRQNMIIPDCWHISLACPGGIPCPQSEKRTLTWARRRST
jgi:hypothetical protein